MKRFTAISVGVGLKESECFFHGMMRASGDTYLQHCVETALLLAKIGANVTTYLQHCVETALLLAKIGANVTVVAAGLLHDTDGAFVGEDWC
ncbi:uncharacterized protein A4U43_C05F3010 [Asparagus officinalis]|uniref:HD domain-containing protein n=1 Tax=Asparagus officinalis TaxID=4686 RepID=A0A5P1ESM9_ASPOF|nr:uncharacterized protein A4U43_C05F3010 [Asparagus officinalis]